MLLRSPGRRGASLQAKLAALPGVAEVRGLGLLLGPNSSTGHRRRRQVCADAARRRPGRQRRHQHRGPAGAAAHRQRGGASTRPSRSSPGCSRMPRRATRTVLEVDDLSPDELATVLDSPSVRRSPLRRPLDGEGVALIFEKPSARTRHSTEMAVVQLGGHPVTSAATRSVSTSARPSRTSPGPWPATTP